MYVDLNWWTIVFKQNVCFAIRLSLKINTVAKKTSTLLVVKAAIYSSINIMVSKQVLGIIMLLNMLAISLSQDFILFANQDTS